MEKFPKAAQRFSGAPTDAARLDIKTERSRASVNASNPSIHRNKKPEAHAAMAASRAPVRSIVMSTWTANPRCRCRGLDSHVHLWTETLAAGAARIGLFTSMSRRYCRSCSEPLRFRVPGENRLARHSIHRSLPSGKADTDPASMPPIAPVPSSIWRGRTSASW